MATALSKAQKLAAHGQGLKPDWGSASSQVSKPLPCRQDIDSASVAPAGTGLAIRYLNQGVGVPEPVRRQRGGARNRGDRVSEALTGAQVANLVAAAKYATAIGLPLNRMITIHWEAAGVPLDGMAAATGRFTGLLAKALSWRGHRTAWLWVHEAGDGKGGHCHLLVHVPPHLVPVTERLRRGWLRLITGYQPPNRAIKAEAIGRKRGLESSNPGKWAENANKTVGYILKGVGPAEPQAALVAALLGRLEPGGRVIGKRCGTSQNIGRKARSEGTVQ